MRHPGKLTLAGLAALAAAGGLWSCRTLTGGGESESALQSGVSPADAYKLSQDRIFDGTVHELHLHMHRETWRKVITHESQGGHACDDDAPYGHVKELRFVNRRTNETVVLNNVGIRVKGNTSCDEPPELKGFKIKLNPVDKFLMSDQGKELWRFPVVYEEWGKRLYYSDDVYARIKGQHLHGLETFALRRGGNDPTRMRDVLSSGVFGFGGDLARRQALPGAPERGGPVYRAGMVWVRIHDGFSTIQEGHYGIVELVGKDLVASHYGKKAVGNLYKIKDAKGTFLDADMPSNRDRLFKWYEPDVIDGDSFESDEEYHVKQKLCGQGQYPQDKCDELKKQRDRAEEILRGFKNLLTEAVKPADRAERRKRLQEFLDVDNILSYAAAANLTGHWDSLIGAMSNNDYLFMNGKTGKWGILTWDLDNTFGAGYLDYPWMAGIFDFGVNLKYRPLFRAVLDNFADEYRTRVGEFLTGGYDFEGMNARIQAVRDGVAPGSTEEQYQNLFKFKNHRWGNAWCQLNKGASSKVKIKDGWPDVYKKDGRYVAECQ